MKTGDLVKLKSFFGHVMNRTCHGTVLEVDDEDMVLVHWWDETVFIPNPSMEKSTNLVVICKG
jgi:hypothetical protein